MTEYRRKATADRRKGQRRAPVVDVAPVIVPPPVIIEPPPVVVVPGSNEPAGMTKLKEHDCSSLSMSGWYIQQTYPGGAVVTLDAAAPKSAPGIIQQNFTPALRGGDSPATIGAGLMGKRTLYAAAWIKHSANYVGHFTGVNKVFHFWTGSPITGGNARNIAVLVLRGVGANPLRVGFGVQGLALPYRFPDGRLDPTGNIDSAVVASRGVWHKYELLLTNNTPGIADGSVIYWMDGVKCAEFSGLGFVQPGQKNVWEEMQWSPTWGGRDGAIVSPFSVQMDHLYLSGK